jgi:BirA family biotin operon repressor/biotin-[acetyl-CoA-carboxylase] ligase
MELERAANQVLERCESTNDLARALGQAGYPNGTWVSARFQERGRGRLGRSWQTIEGNLFLSVIARIPEMRFWTWVPLLTAIAIAEAIRQAEPSLDTRIKWPNDLWIGRAKLGGILCEAIASKMDSFIVIGIGLNCAGSPKGLDQDTISLSEARGSPIIADDIRPAVLESLRARLERLRSAPERLIEELKRDYARLAALAPGTAITWSQGRQGKVLGLGESGELKVLTSEGAEERLLAEDVRIRVVPEASDGSPA